MSVTASEPLSSPVAEYIIIYGLWVLTFLLIWYVSIFYQEGSTFDPFEIMELSPGATVQEIKSKYRQLSRLYHPDKVRTWVEGGHRSGICSAGLCFTHSQLAHVGLAPHVGYLLLTLPRVALVWARLGLHPIGIW